MNTGDRLFAIENVYLRDGIRSFVFEDKVTCSRKGASLGENINLRVDSDDLGLWKVLILLEVALILGLDFALRLAVEVFVPYMSVVEKPAAAADGGEQQAGGHGDEAPSAMTGKAKAAGPGVIRASRRKGNR